MNDWTVLNAQNGKGQLYQALGALPPQQRTSELTRYIEQQVAYIRRQGGATDELSSNHSFLAIGFDSLMSVELLYVLQRDLGRDIDPVALERETIDDLAASVAEEVWSGPAAVRVGEVT